MVMLALNPTSSNQIYHRVLQGHGVTLYAGKPYDDFSLINSCCKEPGSLIAAFFCDLA